MWNHFVKLIRRRCRTLNARYSYFGFNARKIRDETTIRSEEYGMEGSKKLRNVNEKLQFPIFRDKEENNLLLVTYKEMKLT